MVNTNTLPEEIRATIHQDAIQKVSRFFNATTAGCLQELLQNSRRSGATRVDITMIEDTVTVTDNGRGVHDPQALLAFGLSNWDRDVARREDPAGMGIYALARKENVTIRSRTSNQQRGWQVNLEEQHFTGVKAAPVTLLEDRTGTGTTVSFRDPGARPDDVRLLARHYPLPVTLNGLDMERKNFLNLCFHTEEWQGLRIGVYTDKSVYRHHSNLNFHGITLSDLSISTVHTDGRAWVALVDVIDCPLLEPTLPARKELVQNDFLEDLSKACRATIYRAMLTRTEPVDVSKKIQDDAASMGIALPDARPLLFLWEPEYADLEGPDSPPPQTERVEISDKAVIMDINLDPADEQTLSRALARSQDVPDIYAADKHMRGYGWYDQVPIIEKATTSFTTPAGNTVDLAEARKARDQSTTDRRPKAITFNLEISDKHGKTTKMELPADIAFLSEDLWWTPAIDTPLITQDCDITPNDLTDLMMNSFFHPSDNIDEGYNTQREHARDYLNTLSIAILISKQESVEAAIAKAAATHLVYELPRGWEATIKITQDRNVTVDISPRKSQE